MRKAMLLLAAFGLAGAAWAQSQFDGTWVNTHTWVIQNGTYGDSRLRPSKIKADGTDQFVQGELDTIAVKIVNDKTVEITYKLRGRVFSVVERVVSEDGKTLTTSFTNYLNDKPSTQTVTSVRVAAGPSGSHALSGTWMRMDAGATFVFKGLPHGLMLTATDESYEAQFNGKDYPVTHKLPPNLPDNLPDEIKCSILNSKQTVSLKKVNDRSIDETRKENGKITKVIHMTVSTDGKTINGKVDYVRSGTTTAFVALKQ